MKIPKALTIAGSDSGGGAGIQADLKTFAALGVYGMSAVTALTAQNTRGVEGILEVDAEFVSRQVHAVITDIGVDAVKTGMLANAAIISRVAEDLKALKVKCLVVDPVMVAKSGDRLLRPEAVESLIHQLLPLATVVTPNLQEAECLASMPVRGPEDMKEAAKRILDFGPRTVVIKGGHLEGTPLDLFFDGLEVRRFTNPRYDTVHTHGTGCTYASAITAYLARGMGVADAVGRAKEYITGAIREGLPLGSGQGPVHHFHRFYSLVGWNWGTSRLKTEKTWPGGREENHG
ncbi:MAG TPA: bifunctional hydroxymethylpyrimidine kinase/phosphomethylpyrimidine kinase [Syntrophobacteraceae bacterium]|nr:bifunctional hydroxymethylpyrimidine kinase/phosphomethylpyrimidine kinase [Syntrophobacteraceae bacterium]